MFLLYHSTTPRGSRTKCWYPMFTNCFWVQSNTHPPPITTISTHVLTVFATNFRTPTPDFQKKHVFCTTCSNFVFFVWCNIDEKYSQLQLSCTLKTVRQFICLCVWNCTYSRKYITGSIFPSGLWENYDIILSSFWSWAQCDLARYCNTI